MGGFPSADHGGHNQVRAGDIVAAGFHGRDWKAMGDKYRAYIPFLSSRAELNWVLSQMVGELCVSHTYIGGGDFGPGGAPGSPVFTGLLKIACEGLLSSCSKSMFRESDALRRFSLTIFKSPASDRELPSRPLIRLPADCNSSRAVLMKARPSVRNPFVSPRILVMEPLSAVSL